MLTSIASHLASVGDLAVIAQGADVPDAPNLGGGPNFPAVESLVRWIVAILSLGLIACAAWAAYPNKKTGNPGGQPAKCMGYLSVAIILSVMWKLQDPGYLGGTFDWFAKLVSG